MKQATIHAEPILSGPEPGIQIDLQGDLVVDTTEAIKREIVTSLGQCQRLQIVLDQVRSVDAAFIQVVVAAHQMAQNQQKVFSLGGKLSAEQLQVLNQAGFSHLTIHLQPA